MKKKKVIVVCGPTGSGKSDLAFQIAKEFNGELINFDSRQVYKYMDIGTNKDIKTDNSKFAYKNEKEVRDFQFIFDEEPYSLEEIPIHLISFLEPNYEFDAFTFKKLAREFINIVYEKGKLPILVGGTGLYIDALINDYEVKESVDLNLRSNLKKLSLQELQLKLKSLDERKFNSLNESDIKNPRRLIRAIEKKILNTSETRSNDPEFEYVMLYPKFKWDSLKQKIELRVQKMVELGFVDEVKTILSLGFGKELRPLRGIGYKEIIEYLEEKISLEKCIELIKYSHKHYAKRQITWFEGKGRNYKLNIIEKESLITNLSKLVSML